MHQFYWNVAEKKQFRAQADPNPENEQTLILSGFLKQLDNNFTRRQAQWHLHEVPAGKVNAWVQQFKASLSDTVGRWAAAVWALAGIQALSVASLGAC